MSGEKVAFIAARLYQCRDSARFLFGDKFGERMKAWGDALQEVADKTGKTVLQVATDACKGSSDGMRTLVIMAAAVELMEPSTAPTVGVSHG